MTGVDGWMDGWSADPSGRWYKKKEEKFFFFLVSLL
jgi:hypothetical protein